MSGTGGDEQKARLETELNELREVSSVMGLEDIVYGQHEPGSTANKIQRSILYLQRPDAAEFEDIRQSIASNGLTHSDFEHSFINTYDAVSPENTPSLSSIVANSEGTSLQPDIFKYEDSPWEVFGSSLVNSLNSFAAGIGRVIPAAFAAGGNESEWVKSWMDSVDQWAEEATFRVSNDAQKGFFNEPSFKTFAYGMGNGIGSILPAIGTGGAGYIVGGGSKVAAAIGAGMGSYFHMLEASYQEARANGLSMNDAAAYAQLIAPVIATTEVAGLGMLGRSMTRPLTRSASRKLFAPGVKHLAEKGLTRETMRDAIRLTRNQFNSGKAFFGAKAAAVGSRMAEGFAIEGGQEFIQSYIESFGQQMYDDYFAEAGAKPGEGMFGTDVMSKATFMRALEEGLFGGIIGAGMAGPAAIAKPLMGESMFHYISRAKQDNNPANIAKLKALITEMEKQQRLNPEEAATAMSTVDEMVAMNQRIWANQTDSAARYQSYHMFNFVDHFRDHREKVAKEMNTEDYQEKSNEVGRLFDEIDRDLNGIINQIADENRALNLAASHPQLFENIKALNQQLPEHLRLKKGVLARANNVGQVDRQGKLERERDRATKKGDTMSRVAAEEALKSEFEIGLTEEEMLEQDQEQQQPTREEGKFTTYDFKGTEVTQEAIDSHEDITQAYKDLISNPEFTQAPAAQQLEMQEQFLSEMMDKYGVDKAGINLVMDETQRGKIESMIKEGDLKSQKSPVTTASIKTIITKDDRQQLADLGYTKDDVAGMKPEEAQEIINSQRQKESLEESTPTETNQDPGFTTEEEVEEEYDLFHTGDADFSLEGISVEPRVTRQGKKGKYGGLYTYGNLKDLFKFMKGNSTVSAYGIKLNDDVEIKEYSGSIERLTKEKLDELRAQGYQVVRGKSLLGKDEIVVIDKNAIKSVTKIDQSVDNILNPEKSQEKETVSPKETTKEESVPTPEEAQAEYEKLKQEGKVEEETDIDDARVEQAQEDMLSELRNRRKRKKKEALSSVILIRWL